MFGIEAYRIILRSFQHAGFRFVPFASYSSAGDVLLRHDIDFSVDEAHSMAVAEAELGISATYFFMLTSNTYNVLSDHNRNLVRRIAELDHKVSLHFDPVPYANIDDGFRTEKALFESVFDTKIDFVSIHRPGPFLENNNRKLPGVLHSYEDAFFRELPYMSDSGGRDLRASLEELIAAGPHSPLHLLIHPIWWTVETCSPTATLQHWLAAQNLFLIEETKRNCKTFNG